MNSMKINLDELEQLTKASTPGIWTTEETCEYCGRFERKALNLSVGGWYRAIIYNHFAEEKKDADYIVAACNNVPELIKRIHELETENQTLQKRIQELETKNTELHQHILNYCNEDEEDTLTEEIINAIPEDWAEASMKNNIRNGGGRNYI